LLGYFSQALFAIEQNTKVDTLVSKNTLVEKDFPVPNGFSLSVLQQTRHHELSKLFVSGKEQYTYQYKPSKYFIGTDTLKLRMTNELVDMDLPKYITTDAPEPTSTIFEIVFKVTDYKTVVCEYNNTSCSDPWYMMNTTMEGFFKAKGIEILNSEYSNVYQQRELCKACTCLTGSRVYAKVDDYQESNLIFNYNFNWSKDTITSTSPYTYLIYGETYCAGPWMEGINFIKAPSVDDKMAILASYLSDKGIEFYSLEWTSQAMPQDASCQECTCPTGVRYHIVCDKNHEESLKKIGFYDDCTLSAEFEVTPESANQTYVEVEAKDKGAISYQWIAKSKDEQTDIVLGTEESLIISDISNLHTEGIVLPCVECEPSAFFYLPLTLIVDNGLCIRSMMKDIDVNNIPLISVGTKDAQQIKVACYPNPNPGEITISGLTDFSNVWYQLFDMTGKEVDSQEINSSAISFNAESGMYILKVFNENESIYEETIIIKK